MRVANMLLFSSVALISLLSGCIQALSQDDLKEQRWIDSVRLFAKHYPQVVNDVIDDLLGKIDNVTVREFHKKELKSELFHTGTYAMDGECTLCKVLITALRLILRFYRDYESLEPDIIGYCHSLLRAIDQNINVLEMCKIVPLQGPHVAAVVVGTTLLPVPGIPSAEDVCRFQNLCFEVPDPDDVLMEPRNVMSWSTHDYRPNSIQSQLRESRTRRLSVDKENAIKIAQLTDIHIERNYHPGSAEKCGLYICCKEHHTGSGSAGYHGSYECNIPVRTMELFFEHVKTMDPNYVIFTGDIPPHTVWDETLESQLWCTETLTSSLSRILNNHTIYSSIGNHEMFPTNLFSMERLNETKSMVSSFANLWSNLSKFTADQIDTMNRAGYYTILASEHDKLRILSINTNYMYTGNYYNTFSHQIVLGIPPRRGEAVLMRDAISNILTQARANQEKVIVITHHPPGGSSYTVSGSDWWESVMTSFSDVIKLQMSGHTHTDEFKLIKDTNNTVRSMMYVSPSVDMHGWKNPSYRLYYLDPVTYDVIDYEQYYFNLPLHPDNSTVPNVEKLYSAAEEYDLPDLSPRSWEGLLYRFQTNETLILKHLGHSNANAGSRPTSCDVMCRRRHICRQLHARYDHYQVCAAGPLTTQITTTPTSRTWPVLTNFYSTTPFPPINPPTTDLTTTTTTEESITSMESTNAGPSTPAPPSSSHKLELSSGGRYLILAAVLLLAAYM